MNNTYDQYIAREARQQAASSIRKLMIVTAIAMVALFACASAGAFMFMMWYKGTPH